MKKRILKSFFLSLCGLFIGTLPLPAQTAPALLLDGRPREEAIAAVLSANEIRTSLQFRFEMQRYSPMLTGVLESRGRAAFVFPDKLRWEVESPHASLFVLDGADTDRRMQPILRNIQKISEKGLINEHDFTVRVYATDDGWQIDLTPLRRDLGQLFSSITLLTDAPSGALRTIVLTGTDGDQTVLHLKDVVRGGRIDESLFQKP